MKKLSIENAKQLSKAEMKKIMAGSGDCLKIDSSCDGMATTSHSCDPCGIDKTKSTSDSTICCFS